MQLFTWYNLHYELCTSHVHHLCKILVYILGGKISLLIFYFWVNMYLENFSSGWVKVNSHTHVCVMLSEWGKATLHKHSWFDSEFSDIKLKIKKQLRKRAAAVLSLLTRKTKYICASGLSLFHLTWSVCPWGKT